MATTQPITPFQSASLYVGDLQPDIVESVLFDLFNRVGPVASIRVCRDSVSRKSLGYAYVNFHNVQDAERALDTMNFTEISGKPCRIMWSQRDPSLRKTGLGNVFVRNLAPSVDNKGLYDTFSVFGNILSCKVANDENGVSKGYGYVHFETGEAAQDAIQKFDGMLIEDMEVHVSHFVRRQDRATQAKWTNLYAKQFPLTWDETKFKEVFAPYGTILSAALTKDEEGNSKGVGFVNFDSHESAAKAVAELHGKVITEGDATFTLYVGKAQTKVEREREKKAQQETMNIERATKFQGMNLYVKNIAETITDELFREAFAGYGTITSARVMREKNDAKTSKGYGFVCFTAQEDAAKALAEMNGKVLGGKPLVVTYYQKIEVRRQQLAAAYAPAGVRFPQGVAPGVVPFMGMYMPGQPGFPGQQPRGVPPYPYPQQGGLPRGAPGPQGAGLPRGAPVPFGAPRPGFFPPQFPGGMPGQFPRGAPGAPRGQPGFPPMGPGPQGQPGMPGSFPGPQGQRRMGGPGGPVPGMVPAGAPRGPMGVPAGAPRPMYPPQVPGGPVPVPGGPGMPQGVPRGAPQGVKFTSQARNQNAGPMPGMIPAQPGMMGPGGAMPLPVPPQKMDFSEALLATQDPVQQKNMIGEKLYPLIFNRQPELAGKITGMLLEMDNGELLHLIESPDSLTSKVDEAITVLRNHRAIE